jgi:hypothetical protein
MPGEIRRLNEAEVCSTRPTSCVVFQVTPLVVGGRLLPEAERFLDPRCGRIKRISLLPTCHSNLPLLIACNSSCSKQLHLTGSIYYSFPSCKVPLPKYGLAYHAFRPPGPRARSRCSCGKRRPKDQSLAFGHLSTSDYLPCLLCSLCRCK